MWIARDGKRRLVDDGTVPYWLSQGWQVDANGDAIGDVTAAEQALADNMPAPLAATASAGTSTQTAREDHVHTGQQLAAIASPSGGLTADAEARAAIDAIRAALTAHGITL